MSEMVERVAKAIFASQANDRSLDKVDQLTRESVLMAARAAIEAMQNDLAEYAKRFPFEDIRRPVLEDLWNRNEEALK